MNLRSFQDEITPRRVELPGGAVLLELASPTAQSVSFGVWLRRGSAAEAPALSGLSHFLEHMVFKGTTSRSALEVAQTFDALGAMVDAYTTKDYVAFTLRVLPEFFASALTVLADMVLRPALAARDIALEQDVVCEEIQEALDTPEDRLHDAYSLHLYGSHGRGRPILGTPETVRSFDEPRLRAGHGRLFTAPNVVLSLAGNLEAGMADLVTAAFSDLPGGEVTGPGSEPVPDLSARQPGELILQSAIVQTYFEMGNLGVAAHHPDRVPLIMLSNLLGGGMSSRIFQAVREREGLAYTIYTYTDVGRQTGLVSCAGSCSPDKEPRVREVVAAEYRKIIAEGPDEHEVSSTKAQIKSNLVFALEGAHNQMSRAAKNEIYFGRFLPLRELVAMVDAVDREVLQRCAGEYFDPDRMIHAAHRPTS